MNPAAQLSRAPGLSLSPPGRCRHRVAFATASEWVSRLAEARRLQDELTRLGRIPLLIVDAVGYIPFEAEEANLFFQLVSSRYDRVSVIVTSNNPSDDGEKPSVTPSSPQP